MNPPPLSLSSQYQQSVLNRHPSNPIITPKDVPIPCSSVFNCGAVRHDGEIILLLRIEDDARDNHFHTASSVDGTTFEVNPVPMDYPLRNSEKEFLENRFDMRVTPLDGTYYVTHASWLGGYGSCIGIARTDDFQTFEAVGELSVPSNRNAALFPEKINGLYARLERPQDVDGTGRIWISYSPDLIHWGQSRPLSLPKTPWSRNKTGAGPVPIKTENGWLCIYHATSLNASAENYYLSAMLLDLEDPSRVIAAPRRFLLQPEEVYECIGQVPNVVFSNGAVLMDDGTVNIYYGGADTRVCLAQASLNDLVNFCLGGG